MFLPYDQSVVCKSSELIFDDYDDDVVVASIMTAGSGEWRIGCLGGGGFWLCDVDSS